ncbi:hypothetical protein SUDANB60_00813 [Streptomyces sp. enrichment culture]
MQVRSARSAQAVRDPVHHPVFARWYARFSVAAESRAGMADVRRRLLGGLSGRVIEIGAGNGLNFAHYPGAVSEVVARSRSVRCARWPWRRRCGRRCPWTWRPGWRRRCP